MVEFNEAQINICSSLIAKIKERNELMNLVLNEKSSDSWTDLTNTRNQVKQLKQQALGIGITSVELAGLEIEAGNTKKERIEVFKLLQITGQLTHQETEYLRNKFDLPDIIY